MKRFFNTAFIIVFSVSFNVSSIYGQEANESLPGEFNARNISSFTRDLIKNGEYYRAYSELLRLKSYYPNYLSQNEFLITEKYLLFKGKQYDALLKSTGSASEFSDKPELIFTLDSMLWTSSFDPMNKIISGWHWGLDGLFDDMLYRRAVIFSCLTNDFETVKNTGAAYGGADPVLTNELMRYAEEERSSMKSPALAVFAGLVPGMGYAYSGETNTGLVALVVITVSAALTYTAFNYDNKPAGIFIGAIGTFFYSGSIIGGYMAAGRYNKSIRDRMTQNLIEHGRLDGDHETILEKYGINAHEQY